MCKYANDECGNERNMEMKEKFYEPICRMQMRLSLYHCATFYFGCNISADQYVEY